MSEFIPAGKTSLVKKGVASLQVQTEYANRPYPRITTTILREGQVLHKIEKKLERAVENKEEQDHTEVIIQQQHDEVEVFINRDLVIPDTSKITLPTEETTDAASGYPVISEAIPVDTPSGNRPSLLEQFSSIPGFEHVYQIDSSGNFISQTAEVQFRKKFRSISKSMSQVLQVFPFYQDNSGTRERGVCEVEQNRLYLASAGNKCFFISVNPPAGQINYEKYISDIIFHM